MQKLSWILLALGTFMIVLPIVMLAVIWLRVQEDYPAYHDTYYVTVSLGWPTIAYATVALMCLCCGWWLRLKNKGV